MGDRGANFLLSLRLDSDCALGKRTYTPEKQLLNEANKKTRWAYRSFCVMRARENMIATLAEEFEDQQCDLQGSWPHK